MMIRSAADGDREAIFALGMAEEAAWFGQAEISAEEIGEWIEEEGGLGSGVVAVDDAGNVRGFAAPGRHQAVLLADPARTSLLTDELLPWLRERCDTVRLMTFAGDMARVAAFERHGLRHVRSSFLMARADSVGPVPVAAFPIGVRVAPYRFGDDDRAVHRLIYIDAAWGSVQGHAERDLDQWLDTVRRCRSAFVARRDGRPVGWVAGRGLGRAMLLHAFADLQVAGGRDLTLEVQAENAAALGLYRSVGLEVEREWRIYATATTGA